MLEVIPLSRLKTTRNASIESMVQGSALSARSAMRHLAERGVVHGRSIRIVQRGQDGALKVAINADGPMVINRGIADNILVRAHNEDVLELHGISCKSKRFLLIDSCMQWAKTHAAFIFSLL